MFNSQSLLKRNNTGDEEDKVNDNLKPSELMFVSIPFYPVKMVYCYDGHEGVPQIWE